MPRVLVCADVHLNHRGGSGAARTLIEDANATDADVLLVLGDLAVAEGDWLERGLDAFTHKGPRLFVPGNHELWSTARTPARELLEDELPCRVAQCGFDWLPGRPWRAGDRAIVGSLGWYDYAFAEPTLAIGRAFYARGVSPGAALAAGPDDLRALAEQAAPAARETVARWNDAKWVNLGHADEAFCAKQAAQLAADLDAVAGAAGVLVGTHTVPHEALLPRRHGTMGLGKGFAFARAYLGSPRLGEIALARANVRAVVCGHSHVPARARVGDVELVNVGCGYRDKRVELIDF